MKKSLFLAAAFCITALSAHADPKVGYDTFSIDAPHRGGLIQGSLWYRVGSKTYKSLVGDNAVFKGEQAYIGAGIEDGKKPLVIITHGSGGNMNSSVWLSSALAERGALVLGVNHPGSTTGDSSPRRSIKLWQRADDISTALDSVLASPDFAPFIDEERISILGFSLGGATALQVAGLRANKAAYLDYCNRYDDAADCIFFKKGGVRLEALDEETFGRDMKDDRVNRVVAVDPAFTYAFTEDSIAAASLPVQLINLGDAKQSFHAVDVSEQGSSLSTRLSNVRYDKFAPASHFTFLNLCKEGADALLEEEGEDPICTDPAGSNRSAKQAELVETIAAFVGL